MATVERMEVDGGEEYAAMSVFAEEEDDDLVSD